jgi:serine protease AprX
MVSSRSKLIIVLLFFASTGWAQVNRYIVFFKDKTGTLYSVNKPSDFLSQRSIDRRIRQGISITEADLPVNETYVEGVRSAGAGAFFRTKWMNGVLVQCDESVIPSIESLAYVDHVEFVAPNQRLVIGGRTHSESKTKELKTSSSTQAQLHMIGLDDMHSVGVHGENIIIGIFDAGFPGVNTATAFQHIFNENRVNLSVSKDFVRNGDDVFQFSDHGTEVFSIIAAYQEGFFTGGSYEANYQLYVTEDTGSEYRIEEYNWLFAAERADSAGADVINASLGYYDFDQSSMNYPKSALDGKTTVVTRAAQMLADRGVVVVCSAGNEGGIAWRTITAPADAVDVLAVGGVNSAGARANLSSMGPSADGRVKPDVVALALNASVVKDNGTVGASSGTSFSSPLIASLAAGVWQRYPDLSSDEVIEAIRKSASQANAPDHLLGYGIPNFISVVNYIEQSHQENVFDVYPNPITKDSVTIRPFDPIQVTSCKVEVLSSQGQTVHEATINFSWTERTYTSSVNHLSAGMYYMRIRWGDKFYTYKIIKV